MVIRKVQIKRMCAKPCFNSNALLDWKRLSNQYTRRISWVIIAYRLRVSVLFFARLVAVGVQYKQMVQLFSSVVATHINYPEG